MESRGSEVDSLSRVVPFWRKGRFKERKRKLLGVEEEYDKGVGRMSALNSRSPYRANHRRLPVMIIIKMMMMAATMIRSFSFCQQSRPGDGRARQLVGAPNEYPADSLSPQLYNPLSNWPPRSTTLNEQRNPTWRILFHATGRLLFDCPPGSILRRELRTLSGPIARKLIDF